MKTIWNSAFGLLLVTGALLGLTPPIGKLAAAGGAPALLWAFVISVGTGGLLLALLLARRGRPGLDRGRLRYFLIAATISFALPNSLLLATIPHLGAGYAGIMLTLSPVATLLLSLLLGVRRPSPLGIAGIVVGFLGALLVASTRGEAGQPADLLWVGLGLLVPVSLAAGNIYRTHAWPPGAGPIELAAGSHLAAAGLLFAALLATGNGGSLVLLAELPALTTAQVVTSAAMFAFFFRLQAVGGPVYLSQIGYVAAAVGLLLGVLFLGERYLPLTWIGAAVVALGVALTTRAQSRAG